MKLDENGLKKRKEWETAGYRLPEYDRAAVKERTKKEPVWIHFGAGNIFRAFQANVVQNLLNDGVMRHGLIVAEGFDYEIVEKINRPHDDYTILVTLKADGTIEKTVIGSVVESVLLDSKDQEEFERLKDIFSETSLQMASFTITEKGYSLVNGKGDWLEDAARDFENGPKNPDSYLGKITALLYTRYQAGKLPLALVSMDNCSHNGDKLRAAVETFAAEWEKRGLTEAGFTNYLADRERIAFPWSMIDKITPRPDETVWERLKKDGIEGLEPVITGKNTYAAPFVNAEECEYLVIEDWFPNGRPALEKGGILFADRETVDKAEKMKVCTCLNPLHTALAVFGCLLGYAKISEEMRDEELIRLVKRIGYVEGLPVVENPGILDPKRFLDMVVTERIPNPFLPDTPQRIATDTSQKLAVRFGKTIQNYVADPEKSTGQLIGIPLTFAGWLRYLMATDDAGNPLELSPDPLLKTVCPYVQETAAENGNTNGTTTEQRLRPLLKQKEIFGMDLHEAGLAERVCRYFDEMTQGSGAVRKTLQKYLGE